jgi:glycosyltransferase involved in cell wall biosynthesis
MASGKNVWIINQYAGSRHHGMEYRHFYLARELVAKGYDVTVLSGSYSHLFSNPPEVSRTVTLELIDGVRYCWLKVPRYEGVGAGRALNMAVFALELLLPKLRRLPDPDGIIVSSPSPLPIVPAWLLAARHRARLLFEVRDIWPLTLVELGWVPPRHPLVVTMGWVEAFAYRCSDRLLSPLPNALEHMRPHGVDADRFTYVPNGVALDDFDGAEPLDPAIRDQLPDGRFVVGYVGTMGPANALEALLHAADRLRDDPAVEFVLVGTGRSRPELVGLASELELPNLRFLDRVPRAQVPSLLQACDALFVGLQQSSLYHYGISPNKLFDYMYSGRPVIQAMPPDIPDLVSMAGCGITVPAEDADAIAEAVTTIRDMDAGERERLGRNGRAYVTENHSYAALADRYVDALNGSPRRGLLRRPA